MTDYRFRTNWRGKLILQRRISYFNVRGWGKEYYWRDACTEDLHHYYKGQQE